jgi:hypothetical protein
MNQTWKAFEREVSRVFGWERKPLSGANSKHGGGDVIVPPGYNAFIECKYRANNQHVTQFRLAQADAERNHIAKENTMLFVKLKNKHDYTVTISGGMFERMWGIEAVRDLFL